MGVGKTELVGALKSLKLGGLPLCIHSSLRSFGTVEGGAAMIVESLRSQGCTALVPAFSYRFSVPPPLGQRPDRNGWNYSAVENSFGNSGLVYSPESTDIDQDMGAVAAEIVSQPGRCRGNHALNSFAAVGPLANRLISKQGSLDVYGPLKELAVADGFILLMGVGPEKMTLIHLAEAMAGRQLFRRWANGPDGRPAMYETGGCSEGFNNLEPILAVLARETHVGESRWRAFPAHSTLTAVAAKILTQPESTHCPDPCCIRCDDAVRGGPILSAQASTRQSVASPRPE